MHIFIVLLSGNSFICKDMRLCSFLFSLIMKNAIKPMNLYEIVSQTNKHISCIVIYASYFVWLHFFLAKFRLHNKNKCMLIWLLYYDLVIFLTIIVVKIIYQENVLWSPKVKKFSINKRYVYTIAPRTSYRFLIFCLYIHAEELSHPNLVVFFLFGSSLYFVFYLLVVNSLSIITFLKFVRPHSGAAFNRC
jgi:hypothetical protein